jgi:hypothetical protein
VRYEQVLRDRFGSGTVPFGPGGHAVVPAPLAESAEEAWFGGRVTVRDRTGESRVDAPLLAGEGLVGLRVAGPVPAGDWTAWSADLARFRLAQSAALLGDCVRYLSDRLVGADRLLDQQLVRADLADAGTDLAELRALLTGPVAADLTGIHRRLTAVDRTLLRLLGASGFLADGPGRRAAVAELLADVYAEAVP